MIYFAIYFYVLLAVGYAVTEAMRELKDDLWLRIVKFLIVLLIFPFFIGTDIYHKFNP